MASRPRRSAAAPKRFSPPPISTPKKVGNRKVKEETSVERELVNDESNEEVTPEVTIEDVVPSKAITANLLKLPKIEPIEYSVPDFILEKAIKSRKRTHEQEKGKIAKVASKKDVKEVFPVVKKVKTESRKAVVIEKPLPSPSPPPTSSSLPGMPKLVLDISVPLPEILPSTTTTIIAKRSTNQIDSPSTSSKQSSSTTKSNTSCSLTKTEVSSKKGVDKKLEVSRKSSSEFHGIKKSTAPLPLQVHSKTSSVSSSKSPKLPQISADKKSIQQNSSKPSPHSSSFKQPSPVVSKNVQKPLLNSPMPTTSRKPSVPVVKKPVISKPSSSFGLGLLDDILDNQDHLLKDRNKTEQQKAEERQRLEFERRRVSAENPFEKAAAVNDRRKSSNLVTPPITTKPQAIPPPVKKSSTSSNPPIDSKQKSPVNINVDLTNKPSSPKVIVESTVLVVDATIPISVDVSSKAESVEQISEPPPSELSNINLETPLEVKPTENTIETPSELSKINVETPLEVKPTENTIETPSELSNINVETPLEVKPTENTIETSLEVKPTENKIETSLEVKPEKESPISLEKEAPTELTDEPLSTDESVSNDSESLPTTNSLSVPLSVDVSNQDLLKTAEEVLKDFQMKRSDLSNVSISTMDVTYQQIEVSDTESTESNKVEPEEKVPMDFYGEPVPDDDENDDFFEIAAGIMKPKKSEVKKPIDEEPLPDNEMIELDYYNADMNIKSDSKKKWLIDPENGDGFALMYGCVRSNFGLKLPNHTADRSSLPELIVYQIMIHEYLPMKHLPFEEHEPFDLRVGWSDESVKKIVGESVGSYAYCMAGRKASSNVFEDFGINTKIGDVITVVLDILNNEMRIFINNEDLGVMFTDLRFNDQFSNADHSIISPHIGVKNLKVFVNFGAELPDPEVNIPWVLPTFLTDKPFKFFGEFSKCANILVPTPRAPLSKSDCTVIFMVGLPAAGKSKWVENYLQEHSNERWIVLNSEVMLDFMKVNGVTRKRVHQGRWDAIMGLAGKAASRALQLICRRRHNYIIDQTNVSRDARKRKLGYFQDFIRKCVVLVPSADDFEYRQMKQARDDPTDQIPPEALLQLKGMFTLPETDQEPVDEVIFVEPPADRLGDAVEMIRRFNDEGRPYLPVYNQKRK